MRKVQCASILLVLLAAARVSAFDPTELNRITFHNATGLRIVGIYLSPSDSAQWGPGIFDTDFFLKDGSSFVCFIHYPSPSFRFDILAVDESGRAYQVHNYQMADDREGSVTFTAKELVPAPPPLAFVTLSVRNDTGHPIEYMFLSPSDSHAWGIDLLSVDTAVDPGDAHAVVVPVGKQVATYNVLCADDAGTRYVVDVAIDPSQGAAFTAPVGPADERAAAVK